MHGALALISRHGYLIIFAMVFAESVGFPVPAALALVAGGAGVASHALKFTIVAPLALAAMLLGDTLLYILGRYTGWSLLGFLCRIAANPEACILRSAESFYKRGKITLVIAKFIPGINTMAAPLAGSMRMRWQQFLRLDAAGAALYILTYGAAGFLFRDFLAAITRGFQAAGRAAEEVVVVAAVGYMAYRVWLYQKNKVYRVVPRIQVEELARKLASEQEDKDRIVIVDVRSHGYYDQRSERIKGSVRLEPNNLEQELKLLPKDKDIYLYCS
ncbi:MAG: VTT domain-containing protein [Acidobacteriales bacterium]|nr:VTT domain-containing protein [Terriglobales bacterium]